jgi:hypothetical protein
MFRKKSFSHPGGCMRLSFVDVNRARLLRTSGLLTILALAVLDTRAAGADAPTTAKKFPMAVRFIDNSWLRLRVREEQLTVTTAKGKQRVPFAAIQRIEVASRIPDAVAKTIDAAIRNLGSAEFRKREAASAELLKLHRRAYAALLHATKNADPEVARRAQALVAQLRSQLSPELQIIHKSDVVYTKKAKIVGRIEETALKASTFQFGEVSLRLEHVFSMRAPGAAPDPVPLAVRPDPGNLLALQNNVGKTYAFRVTGSVTAGVVWGTDTYTTDSALATAAVHAGALKNGETGVVLVTIVAGLPAYTGSTRNGVTTNAWPAYPAAFTVRSAGKKP